MFLAIRIMFFSAIALISLISTSVHSLAENSDVLCVQETLYKLGFEPGPSDGLFGRRTLEAAQSYKSNFGAAHLPALSNETASQWCAFFGERHASIDVQGVAFFPFDGRLPNPDLWIYRPNHGRPAWIFGTNLGTTKGSVVFDLPGDGEKLARHKSRCKFITKAISSTATTVCVLRPDNPREHRREAEVNSVVETINSISKIWPEATYNCLGHSGGGHSCISASQRSDVQFTCVVAASAILSVKLNYRIRKEGANAARGQYDPIEHVKSTDAQKIVIVGDPKEGSDRKLSYRVWEDFYKRAQNLGLNVEYVKTPGRGHDTVKQAIDAMNDCIGA